ncbi:hypothetical protein R6Q57_000755 [Mikania cordata]
MATCITSIHISVILLAFILHVSHPCYTSKSTVNMGKGDGYVQIKGTNFVINGSPFMFNGFNAYWMMNVATDPSQRSKVNQVLQDAANAGLSVCRTWSFADGPDEKVLQISPEVYNERVFQGLDFVVAEARKYGLRLIISFVNNYKDFGGRPQYIEWARCSGVQIHSDDEFYTNPTVKGYYKNHVERVITSVNTITNIAYRDDTTIMSWELINEPRCQVDNSGRMVNDWVQEMAVLSGQNEDSQMTFMQKWMSSHYEDSKTVIKKPLVIAEFGMSSKDPGYSINKRD